MAIFDIDIGFFLRAWNLDFKFGHGFDQSEFAVLLSGHRVGCVRVSSHEI